MTSSNSTNSANSTWIGALPMEDTALGVTDTGGPGRPVVYLNAAGSRSARHKGRGRRERMAWFAMPLPLPGLAWDLFTDLEPILLMAAEPRSHVVEALDHAGAFESEDIESARTESARRGRPPHRITLTIKGYAGPASAPRQRREYTVSVWASGLTKTWGATVSGHATGGGAAAASYAESLLGELGGQVRAFLQHHGIPADLIGQDPDQPEPPAADDQAEGQAAPGSPARGLGRLLRLITQQPLVSTIVGSTIAGVLATIIIAWLT